MPSRWPAPSARAGSRPRAVGGIAPIVPGRRLPASPRRRAGAYRPHGPPPAAHHRLRVPELRLPCPRRAALRGLLDVHAQDRHRRRVPQLQRAGGGQRASHRRGARHGLIGGASLTATKPSFIIRSSVMWPPRWSHATGELWSHAGGGRHGTDASRLRKVCWWPSETARWRPVGAQSTATRSVVGAKGGL